MKHAPNIGAIPRVLSLFGSNIYNLLNRHVGYCIDISIHVYNIITAVVYNIITAVVYNYYYAAITLKIHHVSKSVNKQGCPRTPE